MKNHIQNSPRRRSNYHLFRPIIRRLIHPLFSRGGRSTKSTGVSNPTSPNRPESSWRLRALRVASMLCVFFGALLFSAGVVGSGEVPVTGAVLRDADRVGSADSVMTPARRGVGPQIPNRQMLVPVLGTNSFTATGLSSDVVGRFPRAGSLLPEDRLVRAPMGPNDSYRAGAYGFEYPSSWIHRLWFRVLRPGARRRFT